MKIAFEGQTIAKSNMTGIGCYALNIMKNVIALGLDNSYSINIFDFLGRNRSAENIAKSISIVNTEIRECKLLPYGLYARYHSIFGNLPYEFYFGKKPDVTHFFNFIIPEKIKSKTITTVHDMVFMLYPETMNSVNYEILKASCTQLREVDAIVTVSQNSRNEISELMKVPIEKYMSHIMLLIKTFTIQERQRNAKRKYCIDSYILYLGTLEPRNVSVIKAFSAVSKNSVV